MRKSLLLLLAITLLLGACSRVGLAYRNLDWLIPWKLGNYVTLTSQQNAWLKPQLREHLNWHCSVELPHYLDWLQQSRQALERRDNAALNRQLQAADNALQRLAIQITPSAAALLQGLSPRQVEQLFAALDEQNAELREQFLQPPLEQQIDRRAARMAERLHPWLGNLQPRQRARIDQWAQQLGAQNQVWLDNRLAWQQALREALEARRGADFAVRLAALLQNPERFHTEAYHARYAANRQALAELLVDLITQADDTQLRRARKHLDNLHAELAAQQCRASGDLVTR